MMWLATVLQKELGVHYRQEVIDMDDHSFFRRSEHLFTGRETNSRKTQIRYRLRCAGVPRK
jgi:hypothetical protein